MSAAKPTITQEQLKIALEEPWEHIKNFILDKGFTTKQVAEESDIPWSTVRSWMNEDNNRETPSVKNLGKLIRWYLQNVEFADE